MAVSVSSRNKFRTIMIFMTWITKGLYLEALGPTMTNYESITRVVYGRATGGFIGATAGAFFVDNFEIHLDLCIGVSTIVAGLSFILVPLVTSIDYVWFLSIVIGCSSCMVNVAGTRLVLDIWREHSSTVLQFIHMGFGLGALFVPIVYSTCIAAVEDVHDDTAHHYDSDHHVIQHHVIQESRVHVALVPIGVFTCCVAVPFILFQISNQLPKTSSKNESTTVIDSKKSSYFDVIKPAFYADDNFCRWFSTLTLLSVYYFNLIGGQRAFATFTLLKTMPENKSYIENSKASYLHILFFVGLIFGCLFGSFLARRVNIRSLICFFVMSHMVSSIAINFCDLTSPLNFWLLTVLKAILVTPLYPLGITYGHSMINMSGFCLMVVVLAGSFGDLAYLWIADWIYELFGVSAIRITTAVAACLVAQSVAMFGIMEMHDCT